VEACGICFSDHLVKDGVWPGIAYPRVPGHEVAGVIDAVGTEATEWKKGERVDRKYPLREVNKVYERMASGDAQFRVVLTM
jgi:D-arabinose 1-dehydrogenase-like Zn-dependent alcohol dehydrogenase